MISDKVIFSLLQLNIGQWERLNKSILIRNIIWSHRLTRVNWSTHPSFFVLFVWACAVYSSEVVYK